MQKNNKRLTLKHVHEKLNNLQAQVLANTAPTTPQQGNKKNVLKSSLGILYVLSCIGFIINKIPFLAKYSQSIKLFMGKASLWTILVILRKVFITMNALIGLWLMFKITGWNQGSFLSAAAAMGTGYMEFFVTFVKKAFDWLYNLLDNKVVPNAPSAPTNNPWSQYNGWNTGPMKDNNYLSMAENARSWYKSPVGSTTSDPWYYSWKTWLFIAGSIVTIAALYSGYVYINDWFKAAPYPAAPTINVQSPGGSNSNSGGTSILRTAADMLIFNRINNVTSALSSIKEFIIPSMDGGTLHSIQKNNIESQKLHQYYPFTPYDPAAPWYDRIRFKHFK